MLLFIWLVAITLAAVLYLRRVYSRFTRYGVKHSRPVPLLGSMAGPMLRLEHITDTVDKIYKEHPGERFLGKYDFTSPVLMVRDLKLLKQIFIKDFEHFLHHRDFVDPDSQDTFARNLFSLKGQEWKDMRSTLSPAFTSSKIRHMVPFMIEAGDQMISSLMKQIEESGVGYVDVEGKDLSTRYANDVIASCAFGLKVDSFTDKNNEFYMMGKIASTFKYRQLLQFMLFLACPQLSKYIKMSLITKETENFFKNLVMTTMENREKNNIIRNDMIHLLMEAKKGTLAHEEHPGRDTDAGFATVEESFVGRKSVNREWSDTDLTAQAVVFFLAGFETISSVMSFAVHELAVHPEVQEQLFHEIREHSKTGTVDYASIQRLTYLDAVVSEVLRLWPPVPNIERECTKDYNMGRPNSEAITDYIIRKGELVSIPVWSIHRDPKHFENPLKFDPDRFQEENKHKIPPFTYMPFGLGPRNCIASRFALCEVKLMLYHLVLNIEMCPSEKTCLPEKLDNSNFNLRLRGGHWVRMKVRK